MSAEALCPICGASFYYAVKDYQSSASSLICEECESNEDLMTWYREQKRKKADLYARQWGNHDQKAS